MDVMHSPGLDSRAPALHRFLGAAVRSLEDGSFVRLVLSSPRTPDAGIEKIEGRLVRLRDEDRLSVTFRETRRDIVRNLPVAEVEAWLAGELEARFEAAWLETTRKDWQLSWGSGRPARLVGHAPRIQAPPHRAHDRERPGPFDDSARDWLRGLGLVDESGKAFPKRADKHRQVLRYAEIVGHWLRELDLDPGSAEPLNIVDMGCGRGYLTFAAWQVLLRQTGRAGAMIGVEVRNELVREARTLVERTGATNLEFRCGTIADFVSERIDVLIALHACDTATDEAMRQGVARGAKLIVVAPCCHQEVRPRLVAPAVLEPLLRHGLLAERFAEWLTDGLRASVLEAAGYRTKVVEFVGTEHTPKNLLLAGVRTGRPTSDPARVAARERFEAIKAFCGIRELQMDRVMEA